MPLIRNVLVPAKLQWVKLVFLAWSKIFWHFVAKVAMCSSAGASPSPPWIFCLNLSSFFLAKRALMHCYLKTSFLVDKLVETATSRCLHGPLLQVAAAALSEKLSVASYYLGTTNVGDSVPSKHFIVFVYDESCMRYLTLSVPQTFTLPATYFGQHTYKKKLLLHLSSSDHYHHIIILIINNKIYLY